MTENFVSEKTASSYLATMSVIFYTTIVLSIVVGQKMLRIGGFDLSAGTLSFPITYMIMATITEVYGLKQARRIIWTGAICNIVFAGFLYLIVTLPPAPFWKAQSAFAQVTMFTSKIFLASTIAYIGSEYTNSFIISKLKILTKGRWLIPRAITSTTAAILLDATLMLPIIFYNPEGSIIVNVFISLIIIKIIYEICLLPILWMVVGFLKKQEGIYENDIQVPFSSVTYMLQKETTPFKVIDNEK